MPVAVQVQQSSRRRDEGDRSERWVTAAGTELPESGIIFPPRLFSDASAGGRYMRELRARTDRQGADPCPTGDEWSGLLLRDSRRRREAETMLDTQAGWFPAPQPSSFLQPGVVLSGTQLVSRRNRIREDWNVTVNVEEVDWARGYVAGSMTASQVPQAKAPITTFWEGEIVGCGGHRFHSAQGKWNATAAEDVSHWIKFGGFQRLHRMWKQRHVRAPPAAAAAPPPPPRDRDDAADDDGPEPMDTDAAEDAAAATAELLLEVEQLDAGWSPLPTERPAGGDRDDADPELEAAEADREAIEAMVAADREVMDAMAAAIRDRDRAGGGAAAALAAGVGAADSAWGSPASSSPSPARSPAQPRGAAQTLGGPVTSSARVAAPAAAVAAAAADASDQEEGEEQQHIFMRWKEQFFCGRSTAEECGLTIAGFYYVQMRRSDGDVTAYYCDPKSAPYQRLDLSVKRESLGRASAAYEFR